jgi:hypothetical protein
MSWKRDTTTTTMKKHPSLGQHHDLTAAGWIKVPDEDICECFSFQSLSLERDDGDVSNREPSSHGHPVKVSSIVDNRCRTTREPRQRQGVAQRKGAILLALLFVSFFQLDDVKSSSAARCHGKSCSYVEQR